MESAAADRSAAERSVPNTDLAKVPDDGLAQSRHRPAQPGASLDTEPRATPAGRIGEPTEERARRVAGLRPHQQVH